MIEFFGFNSFIFKFIPIKLQEKNMNCSFKSKHKNWYFTVYKNIWWVFIWCWFKIILLDYASN